MRVAKTHNELAGNTISRGGNEIRQQRVRRDVKRKAQPDVATALVNVTRQPSFTIAMRCARVELGEDVTRCENDVLQDGRI